jgi:hypothetical protein
MLVWRVCLLSTDRRIQLICALIPWVFVVCCAAKSSDNSANVTDLSKGGGKALSAQANENSLHINRNEALDRVFTALRDKYDVERIFAWSGSDIDGRIMWADRQGRLRSVNFKRNSDEYQFLEKDDDGDSPLMKALATSELGSLAQYLSETEFPVKVDRMKVGDCTAHVIFLWRAESRSFNADPSTDRTLALPGIRVVLNNNAAVKSNSAFNFECWIPREVLVDDMNKDGLNDYCFIGKVSPVIHIWTLTPSCTFEPLAFIEADDGPGARTEFLEGKRIELEKDTGQYSIHVWSKVQFKPQHEEETYRWDTTLRAFVAGHQARTKDREVLEKQHRK